MFLDFILYPAPALCYGVVCLCVRRCQEESASVYCGMAGVNSPHVTQVHTTCPDRQPKPQRRATQIHREGEFHQSEKFYENKRRGGEEQLLDNILFFVKSK